MDPNSNDYRFGVLDTSIKGLTVVVTALTGEVKGLRGDIDEIKLFRAKVLGMAVAASTIVSIMFAVIAKAVETWAR